MLCVYNSSYAINRDLFLVVGLKLIEENYFESRIGITFNSEKVIFTHVEFKTFLSICNCEIECESFVPPSGCDIKLNNHEIMINVNHGLKEIIVKSKTTWNTIRINEKQYKRIFELFPCIDEYAKFISSYEGYANYCFNKIIHGTHQSILQVMSESKKLYDECLDLNLMISHPPKVKEESIRMELMKNLSDDRIVNEITLCYDKVIIKKVLHVLLSV